MDDIDRAILSHLGQDARMSVAVLARRLKLARSTVQARLERLETSGAIAGYTLKLGEAARVTRIRATCLLTIEPRAQPAILGAAVAPFIATWIVADYGVGWVGVYLAVAACATMIALLSVRETKSVDLTEV